VQSTKCVDVGLKRLEITSHAWNLPHLAIRKPPGQPAARRSLRGRQSEGRFFKLLCGLSPSCPQFLNRSGWKAVAVHGDASQAQRTAAVDSFKVRKQME